MRFGIVAAVAASASLLSVPVASEAQDLVFPPGSFSIDGVPVACGNVTYVVTPQVNDVGMANPGGVIYLNPYLLASSSTSMKLFWAAHECGHFVAGPDESMADCWAIRTGRNQGWFPRQVFAEMVGMFRSNPGDFTHAPGVVRLQRMADCYRAP